MKYKLIIFDFDGTLADTLPWFVSKINLVAEKYDFRKIDHRNIETLRGYGITEFLKYLHLPMWKVPMIASHMRSLMATDIETMRLFDGINRMLQKLADRGATLAVVSSNAVENVRHVLGEEMAAVIHHFECGVSLFGKPAKLRHVLHKINMSAREAIYIGDEIRDMVAAKKVRIASGAVLWGYNNAASLKAQSPTELFMSVDDLIEKMC